jgi:hypothetical protein
MSTRTVLLALGLITTVTPVASGQGSNWPFHGFAQVNWSVRTTGADQEGLLSDDFLLGEERLQLELEQFSANGTAGFLAKVDLFYDGLSGLADLEVREGYVDFVVRPFTLRLGRQIMTWGVGDLIFISDAFPKDYAAFFSGRPLQYLKVGADALKLDFGSGLVSAELVLIPWFEADRVPTPDRFVLFDPFAGLSRVEQKPASRISAAEVALRAYRRVAGADLSLHAYRGFYGSPAPQPVGEPEPDRIVLRYPRLNIYSASLELAGFKGVISGEVGYYDAREDPGGSDPWIPNSELRALAGYRRQLWPESQLGVQYYIEWMQDYDSYAASFPPGANRRDELRHVATVRFTQQLAYQTWQLGFFVFLGLSEADYLAIPEMRHRVTEELWGALGANLFGGGRQDLFGALDSNDNVYLTFRYSF